MTRAASVRWLLVPAVLAVFAFLAYDVSPALLARAGLPATGLIAQGARAAATGIAWLALAWFGSRLFDVAFVHAATAAQARPQVPRLLGDIVRVVLFGLAVFAIIATVFGRTGIGLFATSGVLVAVLGFALRNMIADVFSGIALNLEHPYRIGDWIEPEPGVVGQVVEVNWRATRLITRDDTSVVIPNGLIAASRFVNYSYPDRTYRATLTVALDVAIPVGRAERVLLSGALGAPGILTKPSPEIRIHEITDRGVIYLVRYWVPDFRQDIPCRDAVAAAVLRSLHHAGIPPAQPKRTVYLTRRTTPGFEPFPDCTALLRSVDLFARFDAADLAALADRAVERRIEAGTAVVRQGEPGSSLFVIAEGVFEVTVAQGEATSVPIDRMSPGDVFGEMSLLTGQARSASVAAITDAVIFEIEKQHLDPVLRRRPELAASLAAIMAQRQARNAELARRRAAEQPAAQAESEQALLARLKRFFGL